MTLHQAAQKAVELKPCPFCGGKATVDAQFGREWWVECDDCAASTGGMEATRAAAMVAWNRRAESALQQQPEPVAHHPEIDRDSDGELLIDWAPGKSRMLTMTLRNDGRLSYAFTWDGEKAHGTAQMPALQEVPREPTDEAIAAKWNELCGSKAATSWNDKVRAVIQHFAASPSTTQQQEAGSGWKLVPVEPTPEMVRAYLDANNAYWQRTDEMPQPPGRWRTGRPFDATAESYKAMIAAAPSTPAREEALRIAGAAGLDPDPDVVGGSPLGPGEDEYLSWVRGMERNAGVPVNRAGCEVERDAAKCWRQSCAEAGACAAPAAGVKGADHA